MLGDFENRYIVTSSIVVLFIGLKLSLRGLNIFFFNSLDISVSHAISTGYTNISSILTLIIHIFEGGMVDKENTQKKSVI